MFLDDELLQIYKKWGGDTIENKEVMQRCINELMVACIKRFMPEDQNNVTAKEFSEFPTKIKQVDSSWKLFCHKTPRDRYGIIVDSGLFRRYLWKLYNQGEDPISERLFKLLGWEKPVI